MADLKISELPELLSTQLQGTDPIAIADLSGSTTKKITASTFLIDGLQLIPDGSIPADKIESSGSADIADKSVTAKKLADNSSVIVSSDEPTATGEFIGQQYFYTGGTYNLLYTWDGTQWLLEGFVTDVFGDTSGLVNIYVSPTAGVDGATTISADLDATTGAGQFLAGPVNTGGAIEQRRISSVDLPTAGAEKGAVGVNGSNGLAMDGDQIVIDNLVIANTGDGHIVSYDEYGLVTGGGPIQPSDLPLANDGNVGAIRPADDLTVGADGALTHTNVVVAGTAAKVNYDANGHITQALNLEENDIPDLSTDKITTGTFTSDRIADGAITREKLADYSIAYIQEASPASVNPGHIGVLWYQESTGQLRMWNGNSWMPVGFGRLSNDNLRWGGIIDAATGLMVGVTDSGINAGLTIGSGLPAATNALGGLYVVTNNDGNQITVTPGVIYNAGDWCLCINETEGWVRINTMVGGGGGGGGASTLGELLDVTLSAPTDGQFLQLGGTGQWGNIDLTAADIGALGPDDVGDGTITIEKADGTAIGSFTVNQAGDTTISLPADVVPSDPNLQVVLDAGNEATTELLIADAGAVSLKNNGEVTVNKNSADDTPFIACNQLNSGTGDLITPSVFAVDINGGVTASFGTTGAQHGNVMPRDDWSSIPART